MSQDVAGLGYDAILFDGTSSTGAKYWAVDGTSAPRYAPSASFRMLSAQQETSAFMRSNAQEATLKVSITRLKLLWHLLKMPKIEFQDSRRNPV